MIMYLRRNTIDEATDFKGPLAGVAKSSFWARDGIPIFLTQEESDSYGSADDNISRPLPGTIGRSLRFDKTYVVAADGEVYQIESPWPTLQSYAKAVERAAELERRNDRLLRELLTEEAALGLIQFVTREWAGMDRGTGPDIARRLFEEFKAQQSDGA